MEKMEKYYMSDWIDDYEHFSSDKMYEVLSQDPVFDALQEIHEEKMKLMKQIVKKIR